MSRYKHGISLFQSDGKTPFQLLKALKKYGTIDIDIVMASKEKVPVRLVALKLPENIANERRRKAKNNRDKRCKPNKEHMMLLGWEIFVTNVKENIWTSENVGEIYGLRWRIEVIFKAWKSHFHMADVPKGNITIVKAYILSALIVATLFHGLIYREAFINAQKVSIGHISILKLTQFFKEQLWAMALVFQKDTGLKTILRQICYHCVYEKRRNRMSYTEIVSALS